METADAGSNDPNSSPSASDARQIKKPTLYFGSPSVFEVRSPNAQLFATEQDHNLAIRRSKDNSIERLTQDGTEKAFWSVQGARWSPDGRLLVASKVDQTQQPTVPVVRWLEDGEPVDRFPVITVGRPFGQKELWIANVETKQLTRADTGDDPWVWLPPVNWTADGSKFFVLREDNFAKHIDLLAADALTGTTKVILSEASSTFINTEFEDPLWLFDGGRSFFWLSDRTGWKGIYLYRTEGTLVRRITEDATVVVRIVDVDEKQGWVYFTAHVSPDRPYDIAVCRAPIAGGKSQVLTPDPGVHDSTGYLRSLAYGDAASAFSPSKSFFIDRYSSVTRPPVSDLRAADGTLVMTLETPDTTVLERIGWEPPEEFSVLAEDKRTKLFGVIFKPRGFDPKKSYPVIDQIYAGPQTTWAPHAFLEAQSIQPQALAQIGFIVVMLDARGTPQRGKAFQDVVYRNFGRWEVPDHVAALRELAALDGSVKGGCLRWFVRRLHDRSRDAART